MMTCLAATAAGMSHAAAPGMVMEWDDAYRLADEKLAELTLDEKALFMRGHSDFYFYGVPGKGIPFLYLSDATQGVHIRTNLPDSALVKQLDRSTAMPCPIMLTATFNGDMARRYATAIGEECRAGGVEVLLGPGVNITKNAQDGRNYEYMGEDPYLSSLMASNYVSGMLSTGTAPCLKHFICNETEFYRRRSNSVVDERALHEVYMAPFRAGIEAGCPYVMTSYNLVNGEWAGQSKFVIDTLLRRDLGFRGSVMSDWRSVYDPAKVLASGQNTVMPGNRREVAALDALLATGTVTEAQIDDMIRPVIATGLAYGLYDRDKYRPELLDRFDDHARTAYETAAEGIVLLRNNGVLPVADGKKILLCGKFFDRDPRDNNHPSSSADVKGWDYVTLQQGMANNFGSRLTVNATPGDAEIEAADIVLAVVGTTDLESFERPFALPKAEEAFITNVVSRNPNTVVLVLSGSGIRMTGWNDDAAAIVYGWYPGQNGMQAIADLLAGKINPSGKLPLTIDREFSESACAGVMPAGAEFYNTAWRAYNEALIAPFDVRYDESVLTGYRWYDAKGKEPLYSFGHGLSYTTFSLDKPQVKVADGTVRVKVCLTNTGSREGAEVVQVYVGEDAPTVLRPVRELKGVAKLSVAPGKSEWVEIEIPVEKLSFWDDTVHGWRLNPGKYTAWVGTSSADLPHKLQFDIK